MSAPRSDSQPPLRLRSGKVSIVDGVLVLPQSDAVVVVAGLPGAGKTTLVGHHPRALDSDAV